MQVGGVYYDTGVSDFKFFRIVEHGISTITVIRTDSHDTVKSYKQSYNKSSIRNWIEDKIWVRITIKEYIKLCK